MNESDETGAGVVTLAETDPRTAKMPEAAFRPAWTFKGDAVPRILELLEGVPHPWVHACCGSAYIPGEDRRIDLYHPSGESIDIAEIDQHVQDAGAVIIDPPYGTKAWDLPMRQRVVSAAARALRPGGRLILHAPWQPRFRPAYMKPVPPFYVRMDQSLGWPSPLVLLMAWERTVDPDTPRRRKWRESKRRRP